MKHGSWFSFAWAAFPATLVFAIGCNSAQTYQAPPIDAGPPCTSLPPIVSCDAGGPATPTACTADPGSSDDNVARIPNGNYAVGCTVQFYFDDNGGGCSGAHNLCTCLPGDAGSDDAGVPGVWSNCADAGQSLVE